MGDSGVFWRVLGILFLITMMVMPASAQIEVMVEPSPLTIAAVQPYPVVFGIPVTLNLTWLNQTWIPRVPGEDKPTVRTLTLWVANNITNVSVLPTDLAREDGAYVILESVINATIPADDLSREGVANVPLRMQLGGVHSGTFSGNLLFTYRGEDEKRDTLKVPVTVTVKDSPVGPVIVLLVGVLLGIGYFSYQAKGKRRDEILRQYDVLKEETGKDWEYMHLVYLPFFRADIERNLSQTKTMISLSKLDDAEKAVGGAYETWVKWLGNRDPLICQMAVHTELQQEIKSLGELLKSHGVFQYIRAMEQNQVLIFGELTKPKTYGEFTDAFTLFSNKLLEERKSLDHFQELTGLMGKLEEKFRETGSDAIQKKIETFWNRLTVLRGDSDLAELENDIRLALQVDREKKQPPPKEPVSTEAPPQESWWDQVKATMRLHLSWAGIRLGIFGFVSFFLLLILLVIMGFQQLYLANATFGAGPADYFTLFLWGLGVGPGSDAAVKTVRDQFGG